MRYMTYATVVVLVTLFSGCKTPGVPKIEERYGPHTRNVLDFWRAPSTSPTPVLICLHGGGFMIGSKWKFQGHPLTRQCVENGISVVAANYRLVRGGGGAPFPAPMLDGARVVQYVRSRAKEWNIDPDRIALYGGSAGGNMALWIGLHSDLASTKSDDAVSHLSTRVSCILGWRAQTSNDPQWSLKHIGGDPYEHPSLCKFFGVESVDQLKTNEKSTLVNDSSPLTHLSADDPPVYLAYDGILENTPMPLDTSLRITAHHPMFGATFTQKATELGVETEFYHATKPEPADGRILFLKKHFGMDD